MIRFEHTEHLYALALIPILLGIYFFTRYLRKRKLSEFGNLELVEQLMPQASRYKHLIKYVLLMLGLAALIVAWANPQYGVRKEKVKRKSVDVFIALDISASMMAEDVRPSRMDRARRFAQNLVNELRGERMGTIIFAGNAYLQMPLTTDYAAAQLFVKSANPKMAASQGTAISDAIDLAERSFEEENKQHKVLVIISDGENHDQEALDRAKTAAENGLLIFTVGVGTAEGGFIPTRVAGRPDYKRDNSGNPVRSQLNEEMLQQLADAGNGAYFRLSESDKIEPALRERIDKVEKRELEQRSFNEYESYFQYFIGLALIFILLEFVISYRKSKWMEGRDIFKV
ncbi:MAG: VWA domain-containing protein [Bacteroidota bacterium]